jgi:putative NIF3 family GTP cyclohydrolase 1 type 2
MEGLLLKEVVTRIESFAPPSLAQSWDNVGLLVEPSNPMKIDKIILTNDLTEDVMAECVTKGVNMIISYHPPIFKPLKMLTSKAWKVNINRPTGL